MSPAELVAQHLADPQTSFAIGTFGAIVEFHRDPGEQVFLSGDRAVTRRGGIRLQFDRQLRAMSPDRVVMSRLGRIEVNTPIPEANGKTPDGPHTHVDVR